MNDRDYCGNEDALIAFLYDEYEPDERDAIAAHVAHCASCAEEIESLRLTRTRLAAWTPPAAALGFRITQAPGAESAPATVLTYPPAVSERSESNPRWWSRPLPAWAHVAAAVVIFAGGIAVGTARVPAGRERAESIPGPAPAMATVSQQEFDGLRAEVSRLRNVTTAPAGAIDEDAVLRRVAAFVDQRVDVSEARLRNEFDRERAQLVRDFQTIRAQDLRNVQASVAGFQRVTGEELMQQREAISQWNQVIRAGQVVPTSLVR